MTSPLIVVPDCNVLIHGKSLHEIPWEEFDADEIEIRIVGQVVTEVDSLKNRAGRPSRIARDISGQIRTLFASSDRRDIIRASAPLVTRRLWLGKQEARTPVRDGLDLTHGDQAIINQVLAMSDTGLEVVLLTDDTLAAAHAADYGARFRLLPPEWRRPDEQDETSKELERLKAQNARLQAAEPRFRAWFETEDGERIERVDVTLGRYEALAPEEIADFIARVEAAAPMARLEGAAPMQDPDPSPSRGLDLAKLRASYEALGTSLTPQQISKYEEEYAAWLDRLRNQFETLHLLRALRRPWPALTLVAENDGSRPAEQAFVELEVSGDFLIENLEPPTGPVADADAAKLRSEFHLALPPRPPKPERFDRIFSASRLGLGDRNLPIITPALLGPQVRDADAFYWRKGRKGPVARMDLECLSWRHRRAPERFDFRPTGADDAPLRGAVVATLSAANVSDPLVVRLPVRITFEERTLREDAERMVSAFERAATRLPK